MNRNRRRPSEIVSQPLDAIENNDQAQNPTIFLPAADSDGQAEIQTPALPEAVPAVLEPPVAEPGPVPPVPVPDPLAGADEAEIEDIEDFSEGQAEQPPVFERVEAAVGDATEDLAEGIEAEVTDLHSRIGNIEAQLKVPEPNWCAVRARLGNAVFYPLSTESKKRSGSKRQEARGELLSRAVTGINKISSTQQVIVRFDALPYSTDQYVAETNQRIEDLKHDKDGEEVKLTDDQKAVVDAWKIKRDRDGHLETAVTIILVDENPATPNDELEKALKRIATHFGAAYKNGQLQQLKWSQCEPIDAITGRIFPGKPATLSAKRQLFASEAPTVLDNQESAALFHTPDDKFRAAGIRPYRSTIKQLRPLNPLPTMTSLERPTDNLIVWGIENKGRTDERLVGNNVEQENQHVSITGRTGTGKSELLNWRFFCAACATNGDRPQAAVLLDTHGQVGIAALARIAMQIPERIPDIVLLDAGDPTHTVVWNPLAVVHDPRISMRQQIEAAVDGAMGMVQPFARFSDGGTPAAKTLARQVFWALAEANWHLAENEDTDLQLSPFEAVPFLRNEEFRGAVMNLCSSEAISEEFGPEGRFTNAKEDKQSERAQVVLRAFGEMEGVDAYRRMLGTGVSKLNLPELMRQNKLVIFRGSRFGTGVKLGEVLSGMITSQLLRSMEAWGRIEDDATGEIRHGGGIIFGDEAPTWINYDIPVMLAESRKYNVGVELYAQYLGQYEEECGARMVAAILANTATKATLKLDAQKTDKLEKSIAPRGELTAVDLAELDNFNTYQNVLLPGGKYSGPMTTACPPPFNKSILRTAAYRDARAEIAAQSRELISLPNDQIETLLADRADRADLTRTLLETVKRRGSQNPAILKRIAEDNQPAVDLSQDMYATSDEDWKKGRAWEKVGVGEDAA